MMVRSGAGRTYTTDKPAGISGSKRQDNAGYQASENLHPMWSLVVLRSTQLHQKSG